MAKGVGIGLFLILMIIALLHVYWGFGGLWPSDSVEELIRTVIGDPRFEQMPPTWMTLCVAGLIAAAGWIALERANITQILPGLIVRLGSWVLFAVFALRGLSTYLFASGLRTPSPPLTEPFATLDVKLYGPICLIIAVGFLFLSLQKSAT